MSEYKFETLRADQIYERMLALSQQLATEEKENQELRGELEKVKSDNDRHRKLNLDYENQLIDKSRRWFEVWRSGGRSDVATVRCDTKSPRKRERIK